ncbi:MAG: DNA polymerase III subunit gamma/tau [Mariprofundaceae bacterium]|nr:DNA polymerase III subunit gamma/tau [Mariprofundaceae bacterium]
MSYLVLARRWRPRRFSDLVGQDVVVRTLQNAMKNKQMAHAYLLAGIRGTGKTTIARLLAMVVNCAQPDNGEPCGTCEACTSISVGSNLDVQEIDAASHTGVDDIREILDGVRYPPTSLPFKVYIIDEAHMLSKSAFNALLKTLEEPPERVLFLLATTEPEKLPITVRSRCQRFDLRRLGSDEISRYLAHVLSEEKVAYESESLHAIARAADGSVRDALSLTERVMAYGGDTLSSEHVRHALGLVGPEIIHRLSDAVLRGDSKAAIEALRAASAAGHAPRNTLLNMSELWHDLACLMIDASLLEHEPGEASRQWLSARTDCWDTQGLDLRYQVLIQGLRDLLLVDERRGADMLLIRLCALNGINPPQRIPEPVAPAATSSQPTSVARAMPASQRAVAPTPAAADAPWLDEKSKVSDKEHNGASEATAIAEMAEKSPSVEDVVLEDAAQTPGNVAVLKSACNSWEEAVEAYGEVRTGVAAMLEHVLCLDFGDKVRLALDTHQQRAIVAAERLAFAEWLGREVHWEPKVEQQGESLSASRERQAKAQQKQLEQAARDDPHVQGLMQAFDATLETVRAPGTAGDGNQVGDQSLEERT